MNTPSPFSLDPDGLRCPYPFYEQLRAKGPAVPVDEIDATVVTSHAEVTRLLRDPELASSRSPTGPGLAGLVATVVRDAAARDQIPREPARYLAAPHPRTLFTIDPPDHSRQRQLVSRILTPRRARGFEPIIRSVAVRLAANLPDGAELDIVDSFTTPLPVEVISALLRMPPAMQQPLKRWTAMITNVIGNPAAGAEDVWAMMTARVQMMDYFAALLAEARSDPGDDLVTALVDARLESGETLDEGERIGLLINFLVAGNETTIKALSSAARILAEEPEIWSRLRADRSLIATFVEEVLRLEPPTQGMYRYLTTATEISGCPVPADGHVFLSFAAANRDPAVFAEPDEVRLDRAEATRHVSFGHGPHTCLGAWLARLEMQVAVDVLLDHVAELRLAPGHVIDYEPSYLLHGLKGLDVVVSKAIDVPTA